MSDGFVQTFEIFVEAQCSDFECKEKQKRAKTTTQGRGLLGRFSGKESKEGNIVYDRDIDDLSGSRVFFSSFSQNEPQVPIYQREEFTVENNFDQLEQRLSLSLIDEDDLASSSIVLGDEKYY